MAEFFEVLNFSFSVTGPIFVILALGVWLRRVGMLNDAFIEVGSRLVFVIALPALLFISISKTHLDQTSGFGLIAFATGASVATFLLLEWLAHYWVKPAEDRGVVVQGAFRSNMGIIGLAYCVNAYGEKGLVAAALYLGMITILFNVLSVITLSRSLHIKSGDRADGERDCDQPADSGHFAGVARVVGANQFAVGVAEIRRIFFGHDLAAGLAVYRGFAEFPYFAVGAGQNTVCDRQQTGVHPAGIYPGRRVAGFPGC
jgi:predicted permease